MTVCEKVHEILSELSGVTDLFLEQNLRDELALDSLRMVTLLLMLEERLDIELGESDMDPFELTTVNEVVRLAEKYTDGVPDGKKT